jgi:hypothetical protein
MATRLAAVTALVGRVRRVEWDVRDNDAYWVITCPDGFQIQAHRTPSDRNHMQVIERSLAAHGFTKAEEEFLAREDAQRKLRLAEDRARNEELARRVAKQAAAVNGAAGPYGSDTVTIADLLAPHSAPRVYHRVFVTPEMAEALLNAEVYNRKIRNADVSHWSNVLRRGGWRYTHQGVALDVKGRIQDGRHRLTAIAATGIGAEMMITVGMPTENFAVIDTGRRRTASQVLELGGVVKGAAVSASMLRLLWLYEMWGSDMLNHMGDRIDNDDVVSTYAKCDPDRFEYARQAGGRLRSEVGGGPAGPSAAIYLIHEANPAHLDRVESFVDGLIRGVFDTTNDPIFVARRLLSRQALGLTRAMPAPGKMHVVLTAWNQHVTAGTRRRFSVRPDSKMPAPAVIC